MLDSRYIYDLKATTLPLTKELLSSCLDNKTIQSYVLCKYENLITTMKKTHDAIHYGTDLYLMVEVPDRKPNDTIPWR